MRNMLSSGSTARRAIGRFATVSLVGMSAMVGGVLTSVAVAHADSAGPDYAEASYVVNEDDTVTVTNNSDTYAWTGSVVDDKLGTLAASVASSSSAITRTDAWPRMGPSSITAVTRCTVQPCSLTPTARARACVSRPGKSGNRLGCMFSILPA